MISPASPSPRSASRRETEELSAKLLRSRIVTSFAGIALLLGFGSLGYWILGRMHFAGVLQPKIEADWSVIDCLYMTAITVSTVGYGETFPIEQLPLVRLYTILLILTAMILVAYSVSSATAFLVNGDLQRLLLRRRTMREIGKLRGHFVVCGFGVTGRVIIDELVALGHSVVVIDTDSERLATARELRGVLTIEGDATRDETLLEAGIEHAVGLAATLRDDKDNLFVIISVRQLNPAARIVSQASATEVQQKLLRAGADASVASSYVGGLRLASQLIRPAVVTFLDQMLRRRDGAVRFAEVQIGREWQGKTLRDMQVQARTGLPVLALMGSDREFCFNPSGAEALVPGMVLVTMGEVERVKTLERLAGDVDGALILGNESLDEPKAARSAGSQPEAPEPQPGDSPTPPL